MKSFTKIILIIEFLCHAAFSQTGSVKGKVNEKFNNQNLFGANVFIEGTNLGTSTDSIGNYFIKNIPPGNYELSAAFVGYKKENIKINISAGEISLADFSLSPDILSLSEITVLSDKEFSASSSFLLRTFDFELRPRQSTQDMLRLVPGLFIAQHAGGGKAEQIFIRGFDADHGTDINISVDGIPVNMVSYAHGQGYADLHFVIPETVQGFEVEKGPYFAENGDFSTAGTVKFKTIDRLEGNTALIEGGNFGTIRALSMLQLPIETESTSSFAAGEFVWTDGYFNDKINFNRYNLFGKINSSLSSNSNLSFSISNFGAKWNASGQIPERAVEQGLIDRFGSIDNSEGGFTKRTNLNLMYNNSLGSNSSFHSQIYFTDYRFRLFSNFTFFLNDPIHGDEIEQKDQRSIVGIKSHHTFNSGLGTTNLRTTLGTEFRSDNADVELWHVVKRERLKPITNSTVNQKTISLFAKEEISFSSIVRLEIGLRGDYFFFDVEDKLINDISKNISNKKQQVILSPKANLVVSPLNNFDLFFNFGTSFHSNDARVVVTNKNQRTLPLAIGGEAGSRIKLFDTLLFSFSAWVLDLESEFVFVGDEGIVESSGPTRRYGLDLDVRVKLLDWLWADTDANISNGKFKDLPKGENHIPLAPNLTSTGGFTFRFNNGIEGSLRYRHIESRPANENNTIRAKGYTVTEFYFGYNFSYMKLEIAVENLFNTNWNEAQFDTESRLFKEAEPVSDLHFTPASPRSIRGSVSILL